MAGVFGVSASGSSVQQAAGPQQLLSMNNPFTKLDTTDTVSFQTIQLLFNHEPPQPPAGAPFYTNTPVCQFPHPYDYAPATWLSWQNNSPSFPGNPGAGGSNMILYPNGDDSAGLNAFDAIEGGIIDINDTVLVAFEQYNDGSDTFGVSQALLYATADADNINIFLMKQTIATVSGSVVPIFIIGVILDIRLYVFTEPGSTSTY